MINLRVKLKIITNIPVMIISNNALVDLGSFEINGVGYIRPSM